MDIPGGYDILCLCNTTFVSTRALFSTVTVLWVILILIMKCYYRLQDLELASDVKYSTLISAISSALVTTERQGALRKRVVFSKKKTAFGIGQCKLKEVSFTTLNLDIKSIRCVHYFLSYIFSLTPTFYSEFQAVITP